MLSDIRFFPATSLTNGIAVELTPWSKEHNITWYYDRKDLRGKGGHKNSGHE